MIIKNKYIDTKELMLSILAIFFCAVIAGTLTYIILYTFKVVPYHEYLAPIIIVGCIALMIVCAIVRRSSQKIVSRVVLIINLVCLAGGLYFFPTALSKSKVDYKDLEIYREAKKNTTIEKAIEQMFAYKAIIHNTETEKAYYRYYDEDKAIANKLASIDFTYESEGFYYSKSNYFIQTDKMNIYFNYACTGVVVYRGGTRYYSDDKTVDEFYNSYSISKRSATELKKFIDEKISAKMNSTN